MEIAWASNAEVMEHGEGLVRHIAKTLLEERSTELESLGRNLEDIKRFANTPFPRISYDEAVRRLQEKGVEIDINLFFPKLLSGSIIVFDDFSNNFPGLIKTIDKLLFDKKFSRIMTYNNTLVLVI